MKQIYNKVKTFLERDNKIRSAGINEVRTDNGLVIKTYRDLIERIAELSFKNPEFVLFFRGQSNDYRDELERTTLYSSIFRGREYDYHHLLRTRFERLQKAERLLIENYPNNFDGLRNLKVYEILRWAILQHYEVCDTPLLDVTHSIRVACSFAHYDTENQQEAYIYVLGMPQINGSVTASSEHGIQIIRLLSICPPVAKRPYYQEGYLVGEFPTIGYIEKMEYERTEMDFGRRLICKFRISKRDDFWDRDFLPIPNQYLFPNERDDLIRIADEVKDCLK